MLALFTGDSEDECLFTGGISSLKTQKKKRKKRKKCIYKSCLLSYSFIFIFKYFRFSSCLGIGNIRPFSRTEVQFFNTALLYPILFHWFSTARWVNFQGSFSDMALNNHVNFGVKNTSSEHLPHPPSTEPTLR